MSADNPIAVQTTSNPPAIAGLRLKAVGNLRRSKTGTTLDWFLPDGRPLAEPGDWNSEAWRDQYVEHSPLPQLCLVFDETNSEADVRPIDLRLFDAHTRHSLGTSRVHKTERREAPDLPGTNFLVVTPFPLLHETEVEAVFDFASGPLNTTTVPAKEGILYEDATGANVALLAMGNINFFTNHFANGRWTTLVHEEHTHHEKQFGLCLRTMPSRIDYAFDIELLAADRHTVIPTEHPHGAFTNKNNRKLYLRK